MLYGLSRLRPVPWVLKVTKVWLVLESRIQDFWERGAKPLFSSKKGGFSPLAPRTGLGPPFSTQWDRGDSKVMRKYKSQKVLIFDENVLISFIVHLSHLSHDTKLTLFIPDCDRVQNYTDFPPPHIMIKWYFTELDLFNASISMHQATNYWVNF